MGSADNGGCNRKVRASISKSYQLIQHFNYRKKEFCEQTFSIFTPMRNPQNTFYKEVTMFS